MFIMLCCDATYVETNVLINLQKLVSMWGGTNLPTYVLSARVLCCYVNTYVGTYLPTWYPCK
jgi:hypothetical protein